MEPFEKAPMSLSKRRQIEEINALGQCAIEAKMTWSFHIECNVNKIFSTL